MNRGRTIDRQCWLGGIALLLALALTGCKGVSTRDEREARQQLGTVKSAYRPKEQRPALPDLTTNSSLGDFLTYAMLNQPQVEAAYYDWVGAVENITVARSLPDPQLTFQMYIQNLITSVMPGLMAQIPWPGKLRAQAEAASAESRAKYFAFESAVLQAAYDVKQGYYRLWFLDKKIQIDREMLQLLSELERIARAQNDVGRVTLQDVYRAQIEMDRLKTELANLEDSRQPLEAQFKAALGLTRDQPDPPLPARLESTALDLSPEQILDTAFARNPQLKALEAEVRQAQASVDLARKSRLPDVTIGSSVDVKANPILYWPQATVTLPIWRDKIAAQIAAARAGQRAAQARLTAGQLNLTAEFAQKSYDYREITRNLELLREQLIPKAQRSLEIARAAYLAGKTDFFNLLDAERSLLEFRLAEIDARTQRELALSELSLLIAGIPPANAPVLPVNNAAGTTHSPTRPSP
ncbi:MAG TPA: TolC family protein [Candidatus Acidoferrum sp.]|nr:TolC family protein [Candidatus Acidoferrum sp.]